MLKVRTLFSGIGAPEIALRNLKIAYELVDFCEIDKYAVKSYCAVHGLSEEKNLGDITKVWGRNLPYADLLVWGFPCTDISVAGKQKGIIEGETRSGLYHEGLRILKETKPKYSVIENVKNLTGKKFKAEFEQILKDLDEAGYNSYWKVLNAKDYGIPQNRERVFIISIRKDIDSGTFNFPIGFDNGLRLNDYLEDEVDEKYYISQEKTENLIMQLKDKDVSNTIRTGGRGSLDKHQWDMVRIGNTHPSGKGMNGNVYAGNMSPTLTTNKGEGIKMVIPCITPDRVEKRQNGRRFKEDGDPMFTITSQDKHGILQVKKNSPTRIGNIYGEQFGTGYAGNVWDKEAICPTLMTMQGGGRQPMVMTDGSQYRIRKLTPKECWRLMGFGDEDFQKAVDAGVSNSQLYKQAGNSIVTDVLFYVFKNLLKTEIESVYEENKELS
ncbi:DNA cytosine methyltransferase [Clostridium sp. UBA1652]|uniref:DNA cytosine methyltransferase n=1 Tax=Clostridium sp. UBA1652 TaxID=1946348 RepID=UPI00257BE2FF|nr:DNA cytosine methyltransferase [Clostridium sp. UBA1652]